MRHHCSTSNVKCGFLDWVVAVTTLLLLLLLQHSNSFLPNNKVYNNNICYFAPTYPSTFKHYDKHGSLLKLWSIKPPQSGTTNFCTLFLFTQCWSKRPTSHPFLTFEATLTQRNAPIERQSFHFLSPMHLTTINRRFFLAKGMVHYVDLTCQPFSM